MTDYIKKSDKDLIKELRLKREALRSFRFSMWGSKTRNTKEGSHLKKEVAKIMTELKSRALKLVS